MQNRGFRVEALSTEQIRKLALGVRDQLSLGREELPAFLESLLTLGLLSIIPDDDESIPVSVEACYIPGKQCILLRDRDYVGIMKRTKPRAMFTFAHELGHFFLGHERRFDRDSLAEHKVYEDSEWQANTFASEFLMPYNIIQSEGLTTPEELQFWFGVSRQAAEVRLKKLHLI